MMIPFTAQPQSQSPAFGQGLGFGFGQANSNFAAIPAAVPAVGVPGMVDGGSLSAEALGPEAQIGGLLSALTQAFQIQADPVSTLQQQIRQVKQQLSKAQRSGKDNQADSLARQLKTLKAQLAQLKGKGPKSGRGQDSSFGGAPTGSSPSSGGSGGGAAPSYAASGGSGSSGSSGSAASGSPSSFPLDSSYSNKKSSPGVDAMLKHAGSMEGMTESGDTAAIQEITGRTGINPASTPWCAAFAMNLMEEHGVLDLDGLSNPNYCPEIKNWASGKGNYGTAGQYNPKPGDAILFDWEKDGTADHIGLVEKVVDGKVYTIEGNSSDSVKRNSYPLNSSSIDGYVKAKEPPATKSKTAAKPKESSSAKPAA